MPQIPPIDDAYIDDIIKSAGPYNEAINKTQGARLRELMKRFRDYFEQQVPSMVSQLTNDVGYVTASILEGMEIKPASGSDFYIQASPVNVFDIPEQQVSFKITGTAGIEGGITTPKITFKDEVGNLRSFESYEVTGLGSVGSVLQANVNSYAAFTIGISAFSNAYFLSSADITRVRKTLVVSDDYVADAPGASNTAAINVMSGKGIQTGRVTSTEKLAMGLEPYNANRGLLVYQTDGDEGYYGVKTGNVWGKLAWQGEVEEDFVQLDPTLKQSGGIDVTGLIKSSDALQINNDLATSTVFAGGIFFNGTDGTFSGGGAINGLATQISMAGSNGQIQINANDNNIFVGGNEDGNLQLDLTGLQIVNSSSIGTSKIAVNPDKTGYAEYKLPLISGTLALLSDLTATIEGTINKVPKFTSGNVIGNSSIFDNGTILGIGTTSPLSTVGGLDIASGGVSLVVGGDNGASTRTNNTVKTGRMGSAHYGNAIAPMTVFNTNSAATTNSLTIGGGTSLLTAATDIGFYTASNNTTPTGTLRMQIDSGGQLGIGVAPISNVRTAINTSSDVCKGLTITGNSATQSANLFEARTSAGTVVNLIDPNGYMGVVGLNNLSAAANGALTFPNTGVFISRNVADVNPSLSVNLANAASNAAIQQWSFVGAGVSYITNNGTYRGNGMGNYANTANAMVNTPTTGTVISRNIADGNPALTVNNILGTGSIQVWSQGNVAIANIHLDGSLRAPYVANTVTSNNSRVDLMTTGTNISSNKANTDAVLTINNTNPLSTGDGLKIQFNGSTVAKIPYNGVPIASEDLIRKGDMANHLFISALTTVPTPTSTGTKGEVRYVGSYRFECIGTNTWIRIGIDVIW